MADSFGGLSGSCPAGQASMGLDASRCDPGRAFVVMGNDYPDAVFATERAAEAYCEAKRNEAEAQFRPNYQGERYRARIHWRVYGFPLLTGEQP